MGASSTGAGDTVELLAELADADIEKLRRIAAMIDEEGDDQIWHSGSRTVSETGSSLTVTLPKKDAREVLGLSPEDLAGQQVRTLGVGGRFIVQLPDAE